MRNGLRRRAGRTLALAVPSSLRPTPPAAATRPACKAARLLRLPPFLLGAQAGLAAGDVDLGLILTGHFLEQFVFSPLNRPLPPARVWLLDRLRGG